VAVALLAPISVIHNGIDVSAWTFAARTPRRRAPELLFAGRLEYEKGVQDLIAALPAIRAQHPGTSLTIAGEGTQTDWLHELARAHEVTDAVTFAGRQDHDGLIGLMHRCDLIVLPSRYEPFGIVALEAAATGIPLVTSTAGGLGEAVTDGETGWTFPPFDPVAVAVAVCDALDDPAVASARARLAAERLTEEFTWRVVADRTAAVYGTARRRDTPVRPRPRIPVRPMPDRDPGN
jgi:glycogen(starch) synthase